MKKLLLNSLLLFAISFGTQAQRTIYVDFGCSDVTNGNITTGPDKNGNYWSNVTNTSGSTVLVDNKNTVTTMYINVTNGFSKNGILSGGLLAPDEAKLNDFAINTATQDFFYSDNFGCLTIRGLDKTKGYVFSLFGTRNDPEKRVTKYSLMGSNKYSGNLQTSGSALGGTGYNGNNKDILVTDTIMPDSNGQIRFIATKVEGTFVYLAIMKIKEVEARVINPAENANDNNHIAFMGSSVAFGSGGTNNQGYAYFYKQLLASRWGKSIGQKWQVTNVSIGGNTTNDLLNRWERDLVPLNRKYVIFGLSLGNEGITTGGQTIFNQFSKNLQTLITKARALGIEPVVVNCYTRADYNATDYNYVKQMNLLIHQWNVASINVLGAIDNGVGKWATGYQYDDAHPNSAGHHEFTYSFVPSLFDAMDAGKVQPEMVDGTSLRMKQDSTDFRLEFTAEETLHPFTLSFDIQTGSTGKIAEFKTITGQNTLSIENNGLVKYTSKVGSITGTTATNDNQWHKVTLTHYYAWGKTFLYVDKVLQGSVTEKLTSSVFNIGAFNAPAANYRKLLFYRAAINAEEVAALVDNHLLKSSLEIFAPLDEKGKISADTLTNLAQSMNKVIKVKIVDPGTGIKHTKNNSNLVNISPNPVKDNLNIFSDDVFNCLVISDMNGKIIKTIKGNTSKVDVSSLIPGMYLLKLAGDKNTCFQKFIKTDLEVQ